MFNRLHIYTVHMKPGTRPETGQPVFVREGFNVFAFLLTLLWTLYHRLWLASAAMLGFNALLMMLEYAEILSEGGILALMLGMQLVIGFHANDWWRAKLKARGYITAGLVTGDSSLRAELRFFEQYAGT
jgi:hypothetical protein